MVKRGFTLIELLVVIAIIAILASILFPVFGRAREKARQTKCTNNLKQLALQLQIYSQEQNGRYPGSDWVSVLYISPKVFCCPSSTGTEGTDLSYGFNGLLVRADEPATAPKGLAEAQIKAPTEVGAFADCTPINNFSNVMSAGGNLINGGGLKGPGQTVTLDTRHDKGLIAAFCDGHAKYFKGTDLDEKNPANAMTRAFVTAAQVGILDNSGGAIESWTTVPPAGEAGITLGGDYCTRPILAAIAAAWKASGTYAVVDRGFHGYYNTAGKKNTASPVTSYAWGSGIGVAPANPVQIADDAMVVIVAKGSTLLSGAGGVVPGTRACVSYADLKADFDNGTDGATYQAYTYDTSSGSREFFYGKLTFGDWKIDQGKSITVGDDLEMVDKVSTDPKGIGYCSAAFADPNIVEILGIDSNIGGPATPATSIFFPNGSGAATSSNVWRWPATLPGAYPLGRPLFVECGTATLQGAGVTGMTGAVAEARTATQLFKAGYF